MYPAGQPYTRYLRGYSYKNRNGGQRLVNNIQTLQTQCDYPLATSWSEIPSGENPQYMPVLFVNGMTTRMTLTGGGADGPYIPHSYVQNIPPSTSPSTFFGDNNDDLLLNMPQDHLQEHASLSQLPGYVENQVPVPPLDVPQASSSVLQEILEGLQEYPSNPHLLGYLENQVSMPPQGAPLGAPQGSSCLPNLNGLAFEGPASAGVSGDLYSPENQFSDSSPLVPKITHVAKRKREVEVTFVENDGGRQNPTLSTDAHITPTRIPRVHKKADFDPVNCPFCSKRITRPRRLPGHVRICQVLQKRILAYQFSEQETVDAIRKWGIPKFMSEKFSEAQNSNKELRDREDFIRSLSDENVVQKLVEWGVPESMLKHFSSGLGANESSTSQAGPSHPQNLEAADYRTVIEDLASFGSQATPWCATYDIGSQSSSSQRTEESPITNFAPTPSPFAEKQALALWDSNSNAFGLPDGQANEYLIGDVGELTPSMLFGSGLSDKHIFDASELMLAGEPIDTSGTFA